MLEDLVQDKLKLDIIVGEVDILIILILHLLLQYKAELLLDIPYMPYILLLEVVRLLAVVGKYV